MEKTLIIFMFSVMSTVLFAQANFSTSLHAIRQGKVTV